MSRSFLVFAFVAALARPALAHDCSCESQPHPIYASMQVISVGLDGVTTIVMGEATPSFLVTHVLDENGIQNEWLAPLTCDELILVENALYARHHVDFEDPADEAFFAAATIGVYRPVLNLTRGGAERFFTSQDNLTKSRVDRAQDNKSCQEK